MSQSKQGQLRQTKKQMHLVVPSWIINHRCRFHARRRLWVSWAKLALFRPSMARYYYDNTPANAGGQPAAPSHPKRFRTIRSEEHTSELQSLRHLVCRLLLEKKKKQ